MGCGLSKRISIQSGVQAGLRPVTPAMEQRPTTNDRYSLKPRQRILDDAKRTAVSFADYQFTVVLTSRPQLTTAMRVASAASFPVGERQVWAVFDGNLGQDLRLCKGRFSNWVFGSSSFSLSSGSLSLIRVTLLFAV